MKTDVIRDAILSATDKIFITYSPSYEELLLALSQVFAVWQIRAEDEQQPLMDR